MKTYRETSEEVFERIEEYERRKRRARRIALRVGGTAAVFALVIALPVFALHSALGTKNGTDMAPGNEGDPVAGEETDVNNGGDAWEPSDPDDSFKTSGGENGTSGTND